MADKKEVKVNKSVKELIKDKFGAIEEIEVVRGEFKTDTDHKQVVETNYPKPLKRHLLVYENFGASLEESYFWIKDILGDNGYVDVDKIVDTFTASEQSAFFGSAQQRLGIQQDKASQYLGQIGKMVKELFQIVRDIQLLDERERLYILAAKGDVGAEKSLKGVWIDFVDNGPQGVKASSIYGLASQLGYTALPALFFGAPAALKLEDVSKYTAKLEYNTTVKDTLIRKLAQFIAWKEATGKQITSKKKFTISYLRQHYNSIKLYMDWVKPYLRNIKRLGMDPEAQMSSEIVGAFEGSLVEVELLAKKPGNPHSCILVTFRFRTRPIMQTGQDYQRGPSHIGRLEMTFRGYVWSDDDVAEFKKIKQLEDFEMLKSIDTSIEASMDYLGDDLKKYLGEFGEKFGEEEKSEKIAKSLLDAGSVKTIEEGRAKAKEIMEGKQKGPSIFEPFTSIFSGAKELGKGFIPEKNKIKDLKKTAEKMKEAKTELVKTTQKATSLIFTLYKKSRKLIVP